MLILEHWMSRNPVTVPQDATLLACARIMARDGYRHLPVVDGEGVLTGLISDLSLYVMGLTFDPWREQPDPSLRQEAGLPAFFLSIPPDVVAGVGAPMIPVLNRLVASLDDAVIAVDAEGRPVGIFTEHDVVLRAAERLRLTQTTDWVSSRRLIRVQQHQPISTAWAKLEVARVRHVLVYSGDQLAGVLSVRDIAYGGRDRDGEGAPLGLGAHALTAGALLQGAPVTVEAGTPLREVAQIMAARSIGCIPVLRDGGVIQAITRSDITRALAAELEDEAFFDPRDMAKFTAMMS